MSKVLLVNPPWIKRHGNIWRKVAGVVPPMCLASLAAYLEREGHQVEILDAQALNLGYHDIENHITAFNADMLGVTSTTPIFHHAAAVIAMSKKHFPDTPVIMGGPHATALPEETLRQSQADAVAIGEGEVTLAELAGGQAWETIHGLCYRQKDDPAVFARTPPRALIKDLNDIPLPAYHLLPLPLYRPSLGNYKVLPALSIITTRGCYGECTFCFQKVFGRRVRARGTDANLDELEMLEKQYHVRDISFYDDVFLGAKMKIRRFCEEKIRRNIKTLWVCNLRTEMTDYETLRLMKAAGCYMLDYGIETGDEEILEAIKKHTTFEKLFHCINMAKSLGMDIKAGYILGNIGETKTTMQKTLNVARYINSDTAMFNIATPFPGTVMYEEARREGYLGHEDWSKYDYSNAILNQPQLPPAEVEAFYRVAYRQYYLRLPYLWMKLLKLRSFTEIKIAFTAFFTILSLVFFEEKDEALPENHITGQDAEKPRPSLLSRLQKKAAVF